jgi:outer membrane protein OmpA-like peptidoglycan-associated protein
MTMNKPAAALFALLASSALVLAQDNMKTYAKYDFVPGDKIIFEDDLANEQSDEFPSKWDLIGGQCEVRKLNGENVIAFLDGNAAITPLMSTSNYTPEVFTLEFDIYAKDPEYNFIVVKFHGKDTETAMQELMVGAGENNVRYGSALGSYPNEAELLNRWYHVAIAFNVRSLKAYINQHRVLNTPVTEGKPVGIALSATAYEGNEKFIKNIRLAAGGADLYKRVMTDGKYVTRGIKFDVNKATIKPESMGTLNEVAKVLREHPELKFSIEGHTDSDGDDAANLKLSQARAEAVKAQLVMLGTEAARLTCKGLGETKPVDSNTTLTGKANNRRVEFVKM